MQQLAFKTLKETFVARPALRLYNPRAEVIELHTDVSLLGVG